MGMAASQARLLSITSRMSDNELRAQIINNSKMRLATESSRVSEEYVNALNSATMMISNYDAQGNDQYQKLSFNALTMYSAHNNQYGLVNANGKLLVSEADANIFRKVQDADGGLDEFLEEYGLVYKSTYFEEGTFGGDSVYFENLDETYGIQDLKDIYEGNNGHMGYDKALQSAEYVQYSDYYEQFVIAEELLNMEISEAINNDVFDTDWENAYQAIQGATTMNEVKTGLNYLKNKLTGLKNEGKISEQNALYQELMNAINNSFNFSGSNCTVIGTTTVTQNGNTYNIGDDPNNPDIIIKTRVPIYSQRPSGEYDEEGNPIMESYISGYKSEISCGKTNDNDASDDGYKVQYSVTPTTVNESMSSPPSSYNLNYTIKETIVDENGTEYPNSATYQYTYNTGDKTATTKFTTSEPTVIASMVTDLFLDFKASIANNVNKDPYVQEGGSDAQKAQQNYNTALENLATFMFGTGWRANAEVIESNAQYFNDIGLTNQIIKENGLTTTTNYAVIKDIYIMDTLFNTYGEPAWGWVDENDSTGLENADAKAQWYTNLYNRMLEGYKVIEDGLASSNEWIQFALESGLVTMEQVDKSNQWTSMTYTSCSDITEVADDVAVARAEAEYQQAMNSIENKDKRYDMELKNIDTEHNSLQTEYDSVKSVIDKNIERSFKIYS